MVQKTPQKGEISMKDKPITLSISAKVLDILNLITRLEIVADHCDTGNHSPMFGTIYEVIELLFNLINSSKQK